MQVPLLISHFPGVCNAAGAALAKVSAVAGWSTPSSLKQLKRFLGFSNLYQRFIHNHGKVVAPLMKLTSTLKLFFGGPTKQRFFPAKLVVHYSFRFIEKVDASDVGVGQSSRSGTKLTRSSIPVPSIDSDLRPQR